MVMSNNRDLWVSFLKGLKTDNNSLFTCNKQPYEASFYFLFKSTGYQILVAFSSSDFRVLRYHAPENQSVVTEFLVPVNFIVIFMLKF